MYMYLGIDYGSKKVGIALSDTQGNMAFPHVVVSQDTRLLSYIKALCVEKSVRQIALGDGRTASGKENDITQHIQRFKSELEKLGLVVVLVPEFGSSGAARAGTGEGSPRGVVQTIRATSDPQHDAKAAAFILQRFLEGIRHS